MEYLMHTRNMLLILGIVKESATIELKTKHSNPQYFENLNDYTYENFKTHVKDIESTNARLCTEYKKMKSNIEHIQRCSKSIENKFSSNPIYAYNYQSDEKLKYVFKLKEDIASLTTIHWKIAKIEEKVHFYTKKIHFIAITLHFYCETKKNIEFQEIKKSQIQLIILSKIKELQKEIEDNLILSKEIMHRHVEITDFFSNYTKTLFNDKENEEHRQDQFIKLNHFVNNSSFKEIISSKIANIETEIVNYFFTAFADYFYIYTPNTIEIKSFENNLNNRFKSMASFEQTIFHDSFLRTKKYFKYIVISLLRVEMQYLYEQSPEIKQLMKITTSYFTENILDFVSRIDLKVVRYQEDLAPSFLYNSEQQKTFFIDRSSKKCYLVYIEKDTNELKTQTPSNFIEKAFFEWIKNHYLTIEYTKDNYLEFITNLTAISNCSVVGNLLEEHMTFIKNGLKKRLRAAEMRKIL